MSNLISKLGLCLLANGLLIACGSPGVPLPPSLELARPVSDFKATRKGDRVYLAWSVPSETTDGHNIKHPGSVDICRNVGSPVHECATPVAKLSVQKSAEPRTTVAAKRQATYSDQLAAKLQYENPTADLFYAVRVLNSYARSAGLSNQRQVPAAPTLPPPSLFRALVTAEGVQCNWTAVALIDVSGLRFVYRIYRREQGSSKDSVVGELPATNDAITFTDRSIEWEKSYEYRITVVTFIARGGSEQQVEGDDSNPVTVVAHDVFPPAAPSGLQAVFSGPGQKPFIDLVWTPDTEADLAGYNVYRHKPGTQALKLNSELVRSPAFRDTEIQSGEEYLYSVSAVDTRGNESERSPEAAETVP